MSINRNDFKVSMVSLGCSKNLVDAERMLSILKNAGYQVIKDQKDSDVIIVNTCGFIEAAKTEAISAILDAAEFKADESSRVQKIIVSGCLPQRYAGDILTELPEVDIVMGTSHYKDILEAVDSLFVSEDFNDTYVSQAGGIDLYDPDKETDREISTTGYAWLKIAEGCLHKCAFCAIPLIRGKYVSRKMEDIIEEAKVLVNKGYKEIILAAQDTTNYGIDLYKKRMLKDLLHELGAIDGLEVIRVMYGYMDGMDDELINEIATNDMVANYLDIPIQHGNNKVLRSMFRGDTAELITERINKLREMIPGVILRTTVMVGFPGETEEEFQDMKANLAKWKFDRLGCFIFSPEEGTKAFDMDNQIDDETKQRRFDEIYALQQEISTQSNKNREGEEVIVTIDSVSEDGIFYIGRSYGEAPEVDPAIFVAATNEEPLVIGNRYKVKIIDSSEYEMTGVTV
ncbi:MAG: 30S ribosomal protein S12 methylthiotransferase RimO [Saccharofermentans sp.]|nr:30S ribosomal protein S12 methylthiotransferase RimO [Saccharofermentans sp.]